MEEDENLINEQVLFACHKMFRKFLDIEEIVPCLGKHDLLTAEDRDVLLHLNCTRYKKIDHLLNILPRKGREWFEIFIIALTESTEGTGSAHTDLIRALRREKAKRDRTPNSSVQNDQCQPSKIANQTMWFAERSNLSNLQSARAGQAAPGKASPASPSLLRNYPSNTIDIATLEKKQLALRNQVKLLSINESLITQIKIFRDSLINVQSFYVKKFRNHKVNKCSLLSEAQLQMVRMIESLAGCDETFDLIKEIEEWNKCLELMKENYTKMKEVLFSLDDSQIKKQQLELKLDGEAKKEALSWIEGRQSVVENGVVCYDELVKLNDLIKVESDITDQVKMRIDAGKDCLKLWKDWVNLRSSL